MRHVATSAGGVGAMAASATSARATRCASGMAASSSSGASVALGRGAGAFGGGTSRPARHSRGWQAAHVLCALEQSDPPRQLTKFEEAELRWAEKQKQKQQCSKHAVRMKQHEAAMKEIQLDREKTGQRVGQIVDFSGRRKAVKGGGQGRKKRSLSPRPRVPKGGAAAPEPTPSRPNTRKQQTKAAARRSKDDGDQVFEDPNKKWGELTRDWKLMGIENETIGDEMFEGLVEEYGLRNRWRPMISYLVSLGMDGPDLEKLSLTREELFSCGVSRAKGRLDFLEKQLGLSMEEKKRIILKNPRIVEYRIERTMQPRLDYLASLGVSKGDMCKVISRAPALLEVSVDETMRPRVEWLINEVGISAENVGKVVAKHPQVLTYDIDEMMAERVDFLRRTVGVSQEGVSTMVLKHPQILQYATDSMQPRLEYLQSIGMDEEQVVKTVTRLSQLFSLSVEDNLKPKYEYLTSELGGTVKTVTSYPAYFSLSLNQRIKPRHRILQELDRLPRTPFPMKWLAIKDVAFAEGVARVDLEQYEQYRKELQLQRFASDFTYAHKVVLPGS